MTSEPNPDPDEELLAQWVREAGDPMVPPQPQYAETLRARILGRLGSPSRPRLRVTTRAALLLAGVAGLVLLGLLFWSRGSDTGWTQVVAAMRAKSWIHTTVTLPDGTRAESWISPTADVSASREGDRVTFDDYRAKVRYCYDPDKKVLVRTPASSAFKESVLSFLRLFEAILRGDRAVSSPLPGVELVSQTRSHAEERGRSWIVYELVLRSDAVENRLRLRVDPQTLLLHSMTIIAPIDDEMRAKLREESSKGKIKGELPKGDRMEATMFFDYPDHGPADIYALGVPRSVPLEDRVPQGDLARVIDGVNQSREKFPKTYLAIVTKAFGTDSMPAPQFLWRKGDRWRREYRYPVAHTLEERKAINALKFPPAGTDMVAWWKATTRGWRVQPMEFCDGNAVYGDVGKTSEPEWKKIHSGAGFVGEVQWMVPERQGYPHLSGSSETMTVELEKAPKTGPNNTVLLTFRSTAPKGLPSSGYVAQDWIDPAKSYLRVRGEFSHRDPETGKPQRHGEVWIVDSAAQAPNGIWYPTAVRRKGTVDQDGKGTFVDEIWTYSVDFQAEIPDDMFRPVPNK